MEEHSPPDLELAQLIAERMNEALAMDPEAVARLVDFRAPLAGRRAIELFEAHPTIVIGRDEEGRDAIGILGLLNGLCGNFASSGRGPVEAVYGDDGRLARFQVGADPAAADPEG